MGRRGPKASPAGIRSKGWTFYPDRECDRILAKHLKAMRAQVPGAKRMNKNQVLRLVIRQSDDEEWLGFVIEIQQAAAQAKAAQEEAGKREAEARRRVDELLAKLMAYEERKDGRTHSDVQTALRALRVPGNLQARQNLDALRAAEQTGKPLPPPLKILAMARVHVASYQDLQDLLGVR